MKKRKLQNMTINKLLKRLDYLRSKQYQNNVSRQMKYIMYNLKKRGVTLERGALNR